MSVTIPGHLPGRLTGHLPVGPPRGAPSLRRLPPQAHAPRRVREEVRDGLGVIAFSALASTALALLLTALLHQAG